MCFVVCDLSACNSCCYFFYFTLSVVVDKVIISHE